MACYSCGRGDDRVLYGRCCDQSAPNHFWCSGCDTGVEAVFVRSFCCENCPAPETDPGTEPGTDPGTEPGTDQGTEPGTDPGTEPGTDPGTEPGTDPGTEPEAETN